MRIEIPKHLPIFYRFLDEERHKVYAYLHKAFNMEDDDLDDIYQESSIALYLKIKNGDLIVEQEENKLMIQSCSLSGFFSRVCINQTLKFLSKKKRTVPLFDESSVTRKEEFLADKIDTLYHWSTEDQSQEEKTFTERIVNAAIESLPETCRNIFQGYYWNNFTTSVIADMFGFANANSVKTQKYKCVSKFKQKYQELIRRHYE